MHRNTRLSRNHQRQRVIGLASARANARSRPKSRTGLGEHIVLSFRRAEAGARPKVPFDQFLTKRERVTDPVRSFRSNPYPPMGGFTFETQTSHC
jgi:hypothetical protein